MQTDEWVDGEQVNKTLRNDLLKIFAMVTMLLDHIGYMFYPQYRILRAIGRLAFPIFAYQLAVGYSKTSSLKNYAKTIFIFALLSQIPYSFFSADLEFKPLHLNIMFTLLAALAVVYLYEKGKSQFAVYNEKKKIKYIFYGLGIFAGVVLVVAAPEVLHFFYPDFGMDYGFYGLLLVLLFHIFKDRKVYMIAAYIVLSFLYAYFCGAKILASNSLRWYKEQYTFWQSMLKSAMVWNIIMKYKGGLKKLEGFFFQARSIFSLVPIYLLEKYDSRVRLNKYVGYWFYAVHIAVLVLIKKYLA